MDSDISCPIPNIPEAAFGDFDWFLTLARHARLLSRGLSSLYSVGVTGSPNAYYLAVIDQLHSELENWRMSIPVETETEREVEAPDATRAYNPPGWHCDALSVLQLLLALSRATLHLAVHSDGLVSPHKESKSKTLGHGHLPCYLGTYVLH